MASRGDAPSFPPGKIQGRHLTNGAAELNRRFDRRLTKELFWLGAGELTATLRPSRTGSLLEALSCDTGSENKSVTISPT
jgi:hypothetical protein